MFNLDLVGHFVHLDWFLMIVNLACQCFRDFGSNCCCDAWDQMAACCCSCFDYCRCYCYSVNHRKFFLTWIPQSWTVSMVTTSDWRNKCYLIVHFMVLVIRAPTAMWIVWTGSARIALMIMLVLLWLWCSRRHKDRVAFYNVIFTTQWLRHFWV